MAFFIFCSVFFFKQKTADELRISDWSSDVCSSGLKSAFIVLDDAEMANNVAGATTGMMVNSGQTCSAGSRLLVPKKRMAEAIEAARKAANDVTVGDPNGNFAMGTVVSTNQFNELQRYIKDRKSTRLNYSHQCANSMPS